MNFKNIKNRKMFWVIVLDLLMITLLMINLLWIVFDWLFTVEYFSLLIQKYLNSFYEFYLPINKKFWFYDFIFVGIFLVEIIIRWIIAIKRKTYHRWFFYPFVHWYDVLGCIPVGSWRILRILRIISITFRLQKLKIIDISKNYVFKVINKYFNVLMEEVSDRVVVNVLEGIQDETKTGTPVVSRIIDEVVKPQKEILVDIIASKVQTITKSTHLVYENELEDYIDLKVSQAIEKTAEMKLLSKVPMIGSVLGTSIEKTVGEVVFNVINGILYDLSSDKNDATINQVAGKIVDNLLEEVEIGVGEKIIEDVLVDSIEIIKDQVKIQQWKVKDLEEKELKIKAKINRKLEKSEKKKLKKLKKQKDDAVIKDPLFVVKNGADK